MAAKSRLMGGGPANAGASQLKAANQMKPSLIALLVFAMLFAAIPGCSRIYRFEGVIVDGDGNPIGGALINLYPHDWKREEFGRPDGTSEADGTFKASWGSAVGIEFFNMVIAKDGYREQEQLVRAGARNLRIVLERISSTAPDPIALPSDEDIGPQLQAQ